MSFGLTLDRDRGICRLNNNDREEWIDNDETLYTSWKLSRLSKRAFIKEDKQAIDDHICARLGVPREGGWTTAIIQGGPMKRSTKLWLLTGGVAALVGGLAIAVGRKRRADAPMDPSLTPPTTTTPLNEVEIGVLAQGIMRIAMNKRALSAGDMDNLIKLAQKARLPILATSLQSIKQDGKPGGAHYVPLPETELWPGSTMSVRAYIKHRMDQLKAGVA